MFFSWINLKNLHPFKSATKAYDESVERKGGKLKKWKAITFSRNEVYFPPTLKEVEKRINGGE